MKTFALHFLLAFVADFLIMKNDVLALPYNAFWAVVVFLALFAVLWASSFFYRRAYFRKLPKAITLALFFLKELIKANLKIAYDILTPRYILSPAIIALPLDIKTDGEITLLAILITLTPGTLSVDVREDRKVLYVHALYIKNNDLEQIKHVLKHGFERRLMELTA
ncbi:Na+/H+ antiporter subunit E [Adhaeribacter terreus]|uniref:Na+/H+ antiporter subunit E n=1 Tax=Adhaeribacter terreus TaxID=529703 RepID=A0ABW0EBZ8_9BACT